MDEKVTTNIRLSAKTWAMLRELATARAIAEGGRTSASGILEELILAEGQRKTVSVESGR